MVDVGPLTPDYHPPATGMVVCWCGQCSRGLECKTMQQRRAEEPLLPEDRAWLEAHGWTPS